MSHTANYDLSAEVTFTYNPEKVDPFYWTNDKGERQWRLDGIHSGITTKAEMWSHLAYNAIFNSVYDANRLDGWADLPNGALTMRVDGRIED